MTPRNELVASILFTLAAVAGCDHDPVAARIGGAPALIECAGELGLLCPEGLVCADDGADDCDPERGDRDCAGHCQPPDPVPCGGLAGFACPYEMACVDDPADTCDPELGGADCMGICLTPPLTHCGGALDALCPNGQSCVDDPNDDCDPAAGDVDCVGICEEMQLLGAPAEAR